jgi:hypothetical protein
LLIELRQSGLLRRMSPKVCRFFSDACMTPHPRAPTGGVREAPRQEIAGGGAYGDLAGLVMLLEAEERSLRRCFRPGACWRSQHDGCSGPDRPAQLQARRTGAWHGRAIWCRRVVRFTSCTINGASHVAPLASCEDAVACCIVVDGYAIVHDPEAPTGRPSRPNHQTNARQFAQSVWRTQEDRRFGYR